MKLFFVISTFSLIAICRSADESQDEFKLLTKLTPVNNAQSVYPDNTRNQGDLVASASDRTFHINKGYPGGYPGSIGGYPGRYPGYPYDTGIIGTPYRGSLIPGGYTGPGGLIGGGQIGYGSYGNYPGYGGYGGYRGYGGYGDYGRGYGSYGNYPGGYGGYGGYGGVTSYGGYDDYLGRGYGGNRYDGYDNYGYGNTYGSTYAARSPYYPYSYRSDSYGTSLSNPTGYRGYS